jgi:Flp pilus assembly pilin Flp
MRNTSTTNARRRRTGRVARGAVAVEYALLLVAFAVPFAIGATIGGYHLLSNYLLARNMILAPDP